MFTTKLHKRGFDYSQIIKNVIPKITSPSQIETILKFLDSFFPFYTHHGIKNCYHYHHNCYYSNRWHHFYYLTIFNTSYSSFSFNKPLFLKSASSSLYSSFGISILLATISHINSSSTLLKLSSLTVALSVPLTFNLHNSPDL